MTVIAYTVARPHLGKTLMVQSRSRQLAGIYARHGASVRVATVVSGPNAGCVAVMRAYPNFSVAAKAFQAINNDPAHIEFWRERDANPGADAVILRDINRTVYGDIQWDTHPVAHLRVYEISRDKLADAMKLLPDVSKLMKKAGVNVVGLVPITGENLSTMTLSYQFRSLDHWAESLDGVGTSDEFQALVAKAAKFGTLRTGFAMMSI
ncbi:MAG: hypothetical protein JSW68_02430 [Burkholderiales bacterium]|nr:MAG: hypothetical protein JSW68_02430 [Burkholderiales bacterium]